MKKKLLCGMALALVAVGINCRPAWQANQVTNQGIFCLSAEPDLETTPVSFQADAPVHVYVNTEFCLSSSCSRNISVTCELTPVTGGFDITSVLNWEAPPPGANVACTEDCLMPGEFCAITESLAAGQYVFTYDGTQAQTLDVPSEGRPAPCSTF